MFLLPDAGLPLSTVQCLLDCKPRLGVEPEALRQLNTPTNLTWAAPPSGIRISSSSVSQVEQILRKVKAYNLDTVNAASLKLTGEVT